MSDKTVLVIDDSATIRKLVDTHLSPAGYNVVLAPNAEEGLRLATEIRPDLILLDHQLPGTTGYDVCCQLIESPGLRQIPVVVSSTLRKKAYAQYVDLDNVVDMLPKPYTEDLLRTTVANALQTAAMVVNSQSQGTAVPEVINQLDDAALAGSFAYFGLRELIDFLNNGCKTGVLEIEVDRTRIRFHLDHGRIQGVDAAGVDPETVDWIASSFFQLDQEETYDRETVSLLRAEIEHLQAALARRDADGFSDVSDESLTASPMAEDADTVLQRMQELIGEANRCDEHVSLLEEMLHAAEDANRSEQEERQQLEAWVDDIEKRVAQREDEHQAEVESLRQRLEQSNQTQERLVQQLRQAASSGTAPKHYQEHLDKLQHSHQTLQDELAESRKLCSALQQRLGHASEEQDRALREERANIAKEHAKVARLRYEVSSKLAAFEDLPKSENLRDTEAAHRIKVLREHLREIHEQEKKAEKSASVLRIPPAGGRQNRDDGGPVETAAGHDVPTDSSGGTAASPAGRSDSAAR